jgi:hypothetical protein
MFTRVGLLLVTSTPNAHTHAFAVSGFAADLMREEEDIAQRRRNCKEMHGLLRRAMEIVNEVRDFNTFK